MSLCNPFWHFFCKSVWHFTIFPKPLPESDSHMHHTHAPSENENFPSAKPPARTSFLSFFPSHFRSSFRHFCHVLCDFYFSFQVPKPPVFAAFSLLQGILLLILFFLFLRQKNTIKIWLSAKTQYLSAFSREQIHQFTTYLLPLNEPWYASFPRYAKIWYSTSVLKQEKNWIFHRLWNA